MKKTKHLLIIWGSVLIIGQLLSLLIKEYLVIALLRFINSFWGVLGIVLLFIGIILPSENKKNFNKWIILNLIGLFPFIVCFIFIPIVSALSYFETVFLFSFLIWPWYIIGLILIVISSIKIYLIKRRTK